MMPSACPDRTGITRLTAGMPMGIEAVHFTGCGRTARIEGAMSGGGSKLSFADAIRETGPRCGQLRGRAPRKGESFPEAPRARHEARQRGRACPARKYFVSPRGLARGLATVC